jgi:hypothetical protein
MAKKKEIKENVLTINGEKYSVNSLSETTKYFVAQIKDLQMQRDRLQFEMDQKLAALDMMTARLGQSMRPEEEEEAIEVKG